jgi:hypothetical protein
MKSEEELRKDPSKIGGVLRFHAYIPEQKFDMRAVMEIIHQKADIFMMDDLYQFLPFRMPLAEFDILTQRFDLYSFFADESGCELPSHPYGGGLKEGDCIAAYPQIIKRGADGKLEKIDATTVHLFILKRETAIRLHESDEYPCQLQITTRPGYELCMARFLFTPTK